MYFGTDQVDSASKADRLVKPLGHFSEGTHRICQRIQLQIPPKYTRDPIISNLARYEVEVNIHSALLANNSQESGWFDLELRGTPERVQHALDYLSGLHIEIWSGNAAADESWGYR